MSFPSDFRSEVLTSSGDTIDISMNRIGELDGYRLYQTSFDGRGGSILSVTHDPVGIPLTYCGYALFAIAGLMWIVRHFRFIAKAAIICVPLLCTLEAAAVPAVGPEEADAIAGRQVIFKGRIVPFSTVAREFTLKLTGDSKVGSLSAEQFLASLMLYPKEWSKERYIYVKNASLRQALGIEGKYVSPASLYVEGEYLPARLYKDGAGKLDDQIIRLDEKIALLSEAWSGALFTPLPETDVRRRSDVSIKIEVIYNRVEPMRILFMVAFLLGLLMVGAVMLHYEGLVYPVAVIFTTISLAAYLWLWIISGHVPLASAAEIMEFLAVALMMVTVFVSRRRPLLCAIGVLMSGFAALMAWLSAKDPAMTPLMPVLASPWLAVHVSVVMASYALLAMTMPMAAVAFFDVSRRESLVALSRNLLIPGIYLLGIGIILGSVWANQSWGRYWGWDPKETWALVTLLLYAVPLHGRLVPRNEPRLYCGMLLLGFLSIIMTYYGVNFLSSLHAYQ